MSAQTDLATEKSKSGDKDDEEKNYGSSSSHFHMLAKLFTPLQTKCTFMDPFDSPNSTTPTSTRRTQFPVFLKMTPPTQKSDRLLRILMIRPFQCQPYVLGSWVRYPNTLTFVKQRQRPMAIGIVWAILISVCRPSFCDSPHAHSWRIRD